MEYGYKMTTIGLALLTKCTSLEKPLVISGVSFGSGVVPEGTKLATVHTLVRYVAEGTVADRYYDNDRLEFTVQYSNMANPDVPLFYLNEYMVYAKDPESGEDVALLYGNLGDYRLPVPRYVETLPPFVYNFPVRIYFSDELGVEVSAPAGLVTFPDMEAYFKRNLGSADGSSGAGGAAMNKQAVFYAAATEPDIDTLTDGLMLVPISFSKDCPVESEYVYIMQLFHGGLTEDNNRTQIAFPYSDGENLGVGIAVRSSNGGSWSKWSEMAQTRDHQIRTYTSLEELGLVEGEETIESIAAALGEKWEIYYSTSAANAPIYPGVEGLAHVCCINANRVKFMWTDAETGIEYTGFYCAANNVKWIGWIKAYSDRSFTLTAGDLGAVAKSGDQMIGALKAGVQTPNESLVRNQKFLPVNMDSEELAAELAQLADGESCLLYK